MRGVELRPGVDYGEDVGRLEISEGEVMGGGEGNHVAFPCYGFCTEEEGGEAYGV